MSNSSWFDEFYPMQPKLKGFGYFAIKSAVEKAAKRGALAAAEHSLQKWLGALPENLAKHGLQQTPFGFDSSTCALCAYGEFENFGDPCLGCPLFAARSEVSCDSPVLGETVSPFHHYCELNDPGPMIEALRATVEFIKAGKFAEPSAPCDARNAAPKDPTP